MQLLVPVVEVDHTRVVITLTPPRLESGRLAYFTEDRESLFMEEVEKIAGWCESGEPLVTGGHFTFVFVREPKDYDKIMRSIRRIWEKHADRKDAFGVPRV